MYVATSQNELSLCIKNQQNSFQTTTVNPVVQSCHLSTLQSVQQGECLGVVIFLFSYCYYSRFMGNYWIRIVNTVFFRIHKNFGDFGNSILQGRLFVDTILTKTTPHSAVIGGQLFCKANLLYNGSLFVTKILRVMRGSNRDKSLVTKNVIQTRCVAFYTNNIFRSDEMTCILTFISDYIVTYMSEKWPQNARNGLLERV